jgi:hypothetical protein
MVVMLILFRYKALWRSNYIQELYVFLKYIYILIMSYTKTIINFFKRIKGLHF